MQHWIAFFRYASSGSHSSNAGIRIRFAEKQHAEAISRLLLERVLPILFSDDTNAPDFTDIMQANGWDDLRQQVLCMTPRRFGKTTAVSMYVAAVAWHVPSEQAIFSTGRRASSKLLEQVLGLLRKLPGADDRIVKANQEMIWISHPGGKLAKISSYPSCAKTLRGVGGHIIYMEEAAFMDLAVFYEVIVPLLEVRLNGFFVLLTGCSDQKLTLCWPLFFLCRWTQRH